MTRLALLASLLLLTSCSQDRLVGRPEDCPTGCYSGGHCVDGKHEAACGRSGLACSVCGATDLCVEQLCRASSSVPALTFAPGFASLGEKPLAADLTRLTTLQPEEPDRATATPTLYGLRTASQDIVSLGTWDTFADAPTVVAPAVADWDEGHPDISFLDVFTGNRRLLMTGYLLNGVYRLHLYSTQPVDRPVGTTTEQVAGPFAATPIGDFFFLSARGVMAMQGAGVYGLLDGPSINATRGIAAYAPASSAGVGLMATAHHNVGLFGSRDTLTGEQRLFACTLSVYMDAYTTAANHPWPLNLQSCPQVYAASSELVALARMADGFAVLERTQTSQTLRFVPLVVTGSGAAQAVTAGPAELLAEVDPSATVESLVDYGDDLLVVVRTTGARAAHRVDRQSH